MAEVECVLDARYWLGEGPAWHPGERALYLVDVPRKRIHRWTPATGEHRTWDDAGARSPPSSCARRAGCSSPRRPASISSIRRAARLSRFVAPEADLPGNRSNDGKCDRQGRFWYGTMQNNFAPDMSEAPITGNSGWLYRVDADGAVAAHGRAVRHLQHLRLEPRRPDHVFRRHASTASTPTTSTPAPATIANRRPFARVEGMGFGDGSTIDAEGFLWNARWDGGCVIRFAPGRRRSTASSRCPAGA